MCDAKPRDNYNNNTILSSLDKPLYFGNLLFHTTQPLFSSIKSSSLREYTTLVTACTLSLSHTRTSKSRGFDGPQRRDIFCIVCLGVVSFEDMMLFARSL
jgi:hypothetical protein